MKTPRHTAEKVLDARNFLRTMSTHADCPKQLKEALCVALDTIEDLAQGVIDSSRPRMDRELTGKIVEALLR